MQEAAYGTYINGQVVLDEPVPITDRTDVIVVFLNKTARAKKSLLDAFGTWQDPRSANEIAADIRANTIAQFQSAMGKASENSPMR
jgi:hypothetical protein